MLEDHCYGHSLCGRFAQGRRVVGRCQRGSGSSDMCFPLRPLIVFLRRHCRRELLVVIVRRLDVGRWLQKRMDLRLRSLNV